MLQKITVNPIQQVSSYEISWDGYYPYCKACSYEPSYKEVIAGLPETCPCCGAHMSNYKEMWLDRHKEKVTVV